jgi:hypothetical protein
MLDIVLDQQEVVATKETLLASAARQWDAVLAPWHQDALAVLGKAQACFGDGPFAALWLSVRAEGGGREAVKEEGLAIEEAWEASDAAWQPRPGLTLETFKSHRAMSNAKEEAYRAAEHLLAGNRSLLCVMANAVSGWGRGRE